MSDRPPHPSLPTPRQLHWGQAGRNPALKVDVILSGEKSMSGLLIKDKLSTTFKMCILWLAKLPLRCTFISPHFLRRQPRVCLHFFVVPCPYCYTEMPPFSACPGILCHLPTHMETILVGDNGAIWWGNLWKEGKRLSECGRWTPLILGDSFHSARLWHHKLWMGSSFEKVQWRDLSVTEERVPWSRGGKVKVKCTSRASSVW